MRPIPPDEVIPTLKEGDMFSCESGETSKEDPCIPELYDFVYSYEIDFNIDRIRYPAGKRVKLSCKMIRCSGCHDSVVIYREATHEVFEISEYERRG